MSEFTKGEWKAQQTTDGEWFIYTFEGVDCYIICSLGTPCSQDKANAHLIAAAPEMYAMLEACARHAHKTGQELMREDIRELLAKARGEQKDTE